MQADCPEPIEHEADPIPPAQPPAGLLTVDPATWDDAQHLAYFIAANRPNCPACHAMIDSPYDVACPRCRRPLKMGVAAVEVKLLAWSMLLVITAMAAGLGALIVLGVILAGLMFGFSEMGLGLLFALYPAAYMPLLALVLRYRRKLVQASPLLQWTLVTVVIASLVLPFFVGFLLG